jgi:hypothetical protein
MVVPQIPPEAVADPQAWLAIQPGILGQASGLLYALGVFDIYQAFWFQVLLASLALALFVWCVEAAGLAWKATFRRQWDARSFAFWGRWAPKIHLSTLHDPGAALIRIEQELEQTDYGWADARGTESSNIVAARRASALWAEPVVYGALLATLLGMSILSNWGWKAPDWQPAPGESHAIDQGAGYVIRLDEFGPQQDGTGRLFEYESRVTWLQDGAEQGQGRVGLGRPVALPGLTVRQVGYVPVIRMRGLDDGGRSLVFQADTEALAASNNIEVVLSTPDDQALVLLLGQDQFLGLSFEPPSVYDKPALRLVLLQAGAAGTSSTEKRAEAVVYESGEVDLDHLVIEVELGYRPVLRADHRPGASLILAGLIIALAAMVVSWLVRPRLLWIAVGPDERGLTLVQLLALPRTRGSLWQQELASRLGDRLSDDG